MPAFIKGMALCEGFFHDCAKPILTARFPGLPYSAGLIGYGSDVLGYDDAVSTDHMWGPRFYLFLREEDIGRKAEIMEAFAEGLPYTYKGYSVNFSAPDPNDNGVRHAEPVTEGKVSPLIFIETFEEFLIEQLGRPDLHRIGPFEWLAFSEHRLLTLVSGKFFADGLGCAEKLSPIRFYPPEVKLYLVGSNWEAVASEQAFVGRTGMVGDEIGSRMICARIAERLMRLCFLYCDTYAPYSKWFGTAFDRLPVDGRIGEALRAALAAECWKEREDRLVLAQAMVAEMHNKSGLTRPVEVRVQNYFSRDIRVIYADRLVTACEEALKGTAFAGVPLIGSMSELGGLSEFAEKARYIPQIMRIYGASE